MNLKKQFILSLLCILSISLSFGQDNAKDSLFDDSSSTFLPIPLIVNNPTLDTGFGGVGMYFFKFNKEDKKTPPSRINLLGLYSTNKSYILIANAQFYWNEDRNRASVIFGPVRINHEAHYDGDLHLVYSELRNTYYFDYSRKIMGNFYLGLLYLGTQTNFKFDQGSDEENDFTKDYFEENGIVDNFVSSIGLNFSFDNQDYIYNPTKGLSFSIRPKLNVGWLGSENDYVDTDFNFTYFIPLSVGNVLGFSIAGGVAFGDVPFDGYQSYGTSNNLRGYPSGKYRGQHMFAFQTEFRKHIYKRWGAVAFAGSGSIWGNEDNGEKAFERTWLPSAGLGARYTISYEKKINIRLDFAIGVDGNQGIYFGVMESF